MGLGMFLYRVERPMLPHINTTPYDAKHGNPELYTTTGSPRDMD